MHTSQDEARNKTLLGKSGCNEQSCMITSHDLHAPLLITTWYINHSLYKHQSWLPMCWLTVYFYIRSINFKVPCLTEFRLISARHQTAYRARCAVLATQKGDTTLHSALQLSAGFQQHLCSLWEGETESSWKKKKKKAKKHYVLGLPDFWLLKMGMQPF